MTMASKTALGWLFLRVCFVAGASTPAPPLFYHHQLVDHCTNTSTSEYAGLEYTQRYYVWDQEFDGPGSPILIVIGGEGAIEPETGLYYPFVTHHLAPAWGAFVLQPEHRFYGTSQPLSDHVSKNSSGGGVDPRMALLTPEQALLDAIRLLHHIQDELQCSQDKFSSDYCPVMTIGGSYPGWLSAMARLRFPNVIDMAYAASAPMKFYSQQVEADAYYNHITRVAEKSLEACSGAVQETLQILADFLSTVKYEMMNDVVPLFGFCPGSIPHYIQTGDVLRDEVMMIVGYTFANDNMANYPPDNRTRLYHSCQTFLNATLFPAERVKEFILSHLPISNKNNGTRCVEMISQLPWGPNATISSGDWSGVGTGHDGESWDFQTCSWLVEAIGFSSSSSSMFPQREWSLDWLQTHCAARFAGVTPQPYALVREWGFDDLVSQNASRILFTNGMNDGWSVGGITANLSDSLLALNFENGAHHSDLGKGPSDDDTDDIKQGYVVIQQIFTKWLQQVQPSWRARAQE